MLQGTQGGAGALGAPLEKLKIAVAWKLVLIVVIWLAVAWALSRLSGLDASFGTELPIWVQVPGAAAVLLGAAGVLSCGAR